MKTLYLSDLDGTLLDNTGSIPKESIKILNRLICNGMNFSIITARSYHSAMPILKPLELKLPIAVYNGAFIINPVTGETIAKRLLNSTAVQELKMIFSKNPFTPLVYSFIDGAERVSWIQGMENGGISNYLFSRNGDTRLRPVDDYEKLFEGDVFHVNMIGTVEFTEQLAEPINLLDDINFHILPDTYFPGDSWLEIFDKNVSKRSAALFIKEHGKFKSVISFGDNINDIPMFDVSNECYAVSNAHSRLIECADGIIGANIENGVARWLEKNL